MHLSGYRFMWVVAMFDLPVLTSDARRAYARFRQVLLKDGFAKMQLSVYIRHCASRENADVHIRRVADSVPAHGEVRVMTITDRQYERMQVFWGKERTPSPATPAQLEMF